MSLAYRPVAAVAAAISLITSRPAARAFRQAASSVSATTASMPACQCGAARFLSVNSRHKPRSSPSVRNPAARKQREQIQKQTKQTGSSSSGPMSASVFPDDPALLLPALEAATGMLGDILTEDEFLRVVDAASKIIEARRPVTEAQLVADYNITPYQLHMAGVLLLVGNKAISELVPSLFIAISLMHLATAAVRQRGGYLPATLTIVNMIGAQWPQSPEQADALRKTSIYRNAERQFLAYLNKKNAVSDSVADDEPLADAEDMSLQADAFTLAGVLAEAAGEPDRALQWYMAARELGNASSTGELEEGEEGEPADEAKAKDDLPLEDTEPRSIKWNWEQRCLEGIGRLYADQMRQAAKAEGGSVDIRRHAGTEEYKEARTALRTAAMALCSGKAGYLLATDYASAEDSGDGLDMMLYRAAIHNVPGTYDALAKREATKASVLRGLNSSKVTEDAEFHQMLAEEWQTLAQETRPAQ